MEERNTVKSSASERSSRYVGRDTPCAAWAPAIRTCPITHMKVGLLGATGNVGGEFLRLALDNGHEARNGAFFDQNHGEGVTGLALMI